ncbi:MAG: acyl carrier protein, partial [Clostridiales Family XIII bacterium]|nr:acyl carrier protein [Clostridiales Family XIII bacterium]
MDREEILSKLQSVFREFFDDDTIAVNMETVRDDIKGWDSVSHIQLVFEIEEAFDAVFPADEIPNMVSVK